MHLRAFFEDAGARISPYHRSELAGIPDGFEVFQSAVLGVVSVPSHGKVVSLRRTVRARGGLGWAQAGAESAVFLAVRSVRDQIHAGHGPGRRRKNGFDPSAGAIRGCRTIVCPEK